MTTTTDEFMTGGSLPAIKFDTPGQVSAITVRQVDKKVDQTPSGEIKTWPSGDPMHVFVFRGEDDQGEPASLWVRGNMVTAIREATAKAGLQSVIDTKVTVKFTGLGEAKKGMNAPKLYAAKVEKVAAAAPAASDGWDQESDF